MGKSIIQKFLTISLIASLPLSATEEFPFFGITSGYHTINDTNTYQASHLTVFGLRLGKQTLKWRTTFEVTFEQAYTSAGISVDYFVLDEMLGTPKLRPYIGLNGDYLHKDSTKDGYSYGVDLGLVIYASDRIDIDIGYRYTFVENIPGIKTIQSGILGIHFFY